MSNHSHTVANAPARTHAEAAALFRRPFAPGAIGFRAMTKVPYNGQPYAGAQVAAYIGAQSVMQRLNAVVPGRWRQQFQSVPAEFTPAGTRRVYLTCRLIVTLPVEEGGPDSDAVYEDLGEMDSGSLAGVKALYSDAPKRAAVAAGIGAYLYTSLEAVVLPIGPHARQVQAIRRQGRRPHDEPATAHRRAGGHARNCSADRERGAARRSHPDPAAPTTAPRRPTATAPLALELQPLRPLPGILCPCGDLRSSAFSSAVGR